MSPKLPRMTGKDLIRALRRHGLEVFDQEGSHVFLHRRLPDGRFSNRGTVPVHAGKILPPKTLKSILRDAGLIIDHLIELL